MHASAPWSPRAPRQKSASACEARFEQQLADLETARRTFDQRLEDAVTAKVASRALTGARASSTKVGKALADARRLLDAGDDDAAAALLKPLADVLTTARSEIDAAIEARNSRRPVRRTRG